MTIYKMDKLLLVYEFPINDGSNILSYDINPQFSLSQNNPCLKYGFHYYIHQTKKKMEIFDKQDNKKEFHKIVNSFEDTIPEDYIKYNKDDTIKLTDDIKTFSIKFFNTDKIISRAFYKFWEILMIFPLIKNETKPINTMHLSEAPGSFVQALIYYREKITKDSNYKKDKYIATSIDAGKKDVYIPVFNILLEKNIQFEQWKYKNSDITKPEIIKRFILDNNKIKADLITADGGFNWIDENYQEQEAYQLLLAEIYCALMIQKVGGNFIIKFFETFTDVSVKLIEILRHSYKKIYIYKPLLSRPSNSEKYVICIDYIEENKNIEKLYNLLESFDNKYLIDIFQEYEIPNNIQLINYQLSSKLGNIQFKQMNDMLTYYKIGNFYGDQYHKFLLNRKEANDFWISTFYPLIKNDEYTIKKILKKIIDKTFEKNILEYNKLLEILILDF